MEPLRTDLQYAGQTALRFADVYRHRRDPFSGHSVYRWAIILSETETQTLRIGTAGGVCTL